MAGPGNVQKTATTRSSKSTNLSTNRERQRSSKSRNPKGKCSANRRGRRRRRTERDPKSSNPKNSQFCNASGIRCLSDGPMVQQVGGEVSFGPIVRSLPATRRPI
jgi:hypothetical protein